MARVPAAARARGRGAAVPRVPHRCRLVGRALRRRLRAARGRLLVEGGQSSQVSIRKAEARAAEEARAEARAAKRAEAMRLKEEKAAEEELKPVLELCKQVLGDGVDKVTVSSRLTSSPAALVQPQWGMSPQMQQDACTAAAEGIQMFYEENEIAGYVKSEFEKKVCDSLWQVV